MARTAVTALKLVSATADVVMPRRRGIVVLIYHRVGGASGTEVDLPIALFDAQIGELAASQRAITLDDALADLEHGRKNDRAIDGPDPVVVTFDDGTADFADQALPVLARHRVPATIYVATAFVEERRAFPHDGAPLSWSALADAVATRLVAVGSHTHTHALLDRLPVAEVVTELDRSRELVEDRLGTSCDHFAYPKALAGSADADALVRARFRSAALAGTRPNRYGRTDPHCLARTPLQVADGMRWFHRKVAGGMAFEDTLRQLANRRRYAGATT